MLDIILDTLLDSIKLIPFLFLTFLFIEFIEHKLKSTKKIEQAKQFGPLLGSILGAFPQCGFSASATNLYVTRVISLGTLISIYLSTSDEMLPLMISKNIDIRIILKFISFKVVLGFVYGLIIDLIIKKREKVNIKKFCNNEECNCKENIFLSSLKHTLSTCIFIIIISFLLNVGFSYLGYEKISKLFMKNNIFSSFLVSFLGLIPNCSSSVLITELFLNNVITFSSALAGLMTNSGIAIIILFKTNKNLKENIKILLLVYLLGSATGVLLDFVNLIV